MKIIATLIVASLLSGCAGMVATSENLEGANATLTPRGATYQDLISLPPTCQYFFHRRHPRCRSNADRRTGGFRLVYTA